MISDISFEVPYGAIGAVGSSSRTGTCSALP
jgi:hypothetical protein